MRAAACSTRPSSCGLMPVQDREPRQERPGREQQRVAGSGRPGPRRPRGQARCRPARRRCRNIPRAASPTPPRSRRSESTSRYCPKVARATVPRGRPPRRPPARIEAEVEERARALGPPERRRERRHALTHGRVARLVAEQGGERRGEALVVLRRDRLAERAAVHQLADRVARRHHRRQPRPEVVEHARAEREARLEMVVVGAHAHVGLEQVRPALGVGHPARVEVHALLQAAVAREPARLLLAGRHGGRVERRAARAQEHEVHRPAPGSPSRSSARDRRERVEPAPDAAGPQQHPVVRADARPDALHHGSVAPRRLAPGARTAPRPRTRGRWGRPRSGRGRSAR